MHRGKNSTYLAGEKKEEVEGETSIFSSSFDRKA